MPYAPMDTINWKALAEARSTLTDRDMTLAKLREWNDRKALRDAEAQYQMQELGSKSQLLPVQTQHDLMKAQYGIDSMPQEQQVNQMGNQAKVMQYDDLIKNFPNDANLKRLVMQSQIAKNLGGGQANDKPVWSAENGAWVIPPNAQNPQGKLIQPEGATARKKPLPPSAWKLINEETNAMNQAADINTRMKPFSEQIDKGELPLGAYQNLLSKVKNSGWLSGIGLSSDKGSRNYASFTANLEKLRNDSLRLNSGVQTEGDAQRAWNELIANINDPELVKQRLGEIETINERARQLRGMNVDNIRANYGLDPLESQSAAPAQGGTSSQQGWSIKKVP